jgi:uncharacterized RDD family membrane protein YckC
MSQYGNPPDPEQPSNPYGAPPPPPHPYGEPSPYEGPYGGGAPQDPYGAPPASPSGGAPANPYAAPGNQYGSGHALPYGHPRDPFAAAGYASWISRVAAYLIDALLGAVAGLPLWIGYGILVANTTTTTDANGAKTAHLHSGGGAAILIVFGLVTSAAFWIWNVCIKQGRTGATIGKGVLAIRLLGYSGQPIGAGLSFVRQLAHFLDSLACYIGWLWPLWDARKQTFADKIMSTVVVNASAPSPPV